MYKASLPPLPWATQEELYPRRFLAKIIIKKKKLIKQHRTLEIVVFGVEEDVPGGQLELLCWKLWDALRLFVVWNAAKPLSGHGSPMLWYQSQLLPPPGQRCQRVSPHPALHAPSPARSPAGALRSLPAPFQVPEAGGSQLHLCKLDGILVALPVEPVDALTVAVVTISAHQVDSVTVLVPESSFV